MNWQPPKAIQLGLFASALLFFWIFVGADTSASEPPADAPPLHPNEPKLSIELRGDVEIIPSVPEEERGEEEQGLRPPHGITRSYQIVQADHEVKSIDPKKKEATRRVYLEVVRESRGNPISLEQMRRIYQTGDFEIVKTLIEEKVVTPEHSMQMADLRILMILQTCEHIIMQKDGRWHINRSDSGNQMAGMSSDVDQTCYIYEWDGQRWVRNEAMDAEFRILFEKQFQADHKISVVDLDIATISGKDKFPDPRLTETYLTQRGSRGVPLHAAETMFALRRTPGAYTYCGAVVQQMQLRAAEMIDSSLRAGAGEAGVPDPRPIHPELLQHNPEFKLRWNTFLQIGPGETPEGEVLVREQFQEDAVRVMFDGAIPRLIRGHSYDAAVANYIEFMHHLADKNPAVKYVLRALDDGLNTFRRLNPERFGHIPRVEYGSLPQNQRRGYLIELFGADLAQRRWDGTSFLDNWKTVFDISAELRELHKNKTLTDETTTQAFRKLAEQIAGEDRSNWRNYLSEARTEYNRRVQEFMLYNIVETSEARICEWVAAQADDPRQHAVYETILDECEIRRFLNLEGPENDTRWRQIRQEVLDNYGELARLQMLYSFRDLQHRPDLVELIIKQAKSRGLNPAELAKLKMFATESRSILFTVREFARAPEAHLLYYRAQGRAHLTRLAESYMQHVVAEFGFVDTPHGRKPTQLLKMVGMHGLHQHVQGFLNTHPVAAVTDRYIGMNYLNIGGVQSMANILSAYCQSGGDPNAFWQAAGTEFLITVPVVGQVHMVLQGGDLIEEGHYLEGGVQIATVILMVQVPQLGVVMAVYGITEQGLVIYEYEYTRPFTNSLADAIYRGYVGPSLRDFTFEGAPPRFTEDDEKALLEAQEDVFALTFAIRRKAGADVSEELRFSEKAIRDALRAASGLYCGYSTLREHLRPAILEYKLSDMIAKSGDELAKELARAGHAQMRLFRKKSSWEAYLLQENRYRGGAIEEFFGRQLYGAGRQMDQRPLELPRPSDPTYHDDLLGVSGTLLARVEPIILYSRNAKMGPVDFTTDPLTENQEARLAELDEKLQEPQLPHEGAQMAIERYALRQQKDACERADRYLKKAKTDHELMHQIRRDSLWPHIVQERAFEPILKTEEFIRSWLAVRRDIFPPAFSKLGINVESTRPYSDAVIEELNDRLFFDIRRSKRLWLLHQEAQKVNRRMSQEEAVGLASRLASESLMQAAIDRPQVLSSETVEAFRNAGLNPREAASLRPVAGAIFRRHEPESPPEVMVSVRRIFARDPDGKPGHEFRTDVKVTANPEIYIPPYWQVTYQLDPSSVRGAVQSKMHLGLPLDKPTVEALRKHLQCLEAVPSSSAAAEEKFTPAVLTFVFCHNVRIPDRVVPETIAQLPQLTVHEIPIPAGMEELPDHLRSGYLFGSSAAAPKPVEPPKIEPVANHDVIVGTWLQAVKESGRRSGGEASQFQFVRPSGEERFEIHIEKTEDGYVARYNRVPQRQTADLLGFGERIEVGQAFGRFTAAGQSRDDRPAYRFHRWSAGNGRFSTTGKSLFLAEDDRLVTDRFEVWFRK